MREWVRQVLECLTWGGAGVPAVCHIKAGGTVGHYYNEEAPQAADVRPLPFCIRTPHLYCTAGDNFHIGNFARRIRNIISIGDVFFWNIIWEKDSKEFIFEEKVSIRRGLSMQIFTTAVADAQENKKEKFSTTPCWT